MDEDYVTISHTVDPRKFCVQVMRYNPRADEYLSARTSQPLARPAAEALAQSWASALRLEIR